MGLSYMFFLLLQYANLRSLYRNNKKIYDLFKRPILSLFERYITFQTDLLMRVFSNNELNQFIHTSMFKRDPFHIMIFKEKIYEMGGCCTTQNWQFTGRNSYLWEKLKYFNFLNLKILSE